MTSRSPRPLPPRLRNRSRKGTRPPVRTRPDKNISFLAVFAALFSLAARAGKGQRSITLAEPKRSK